MAELQERIDKALRKEEERAERLANNVRFLLLTIFAAMALVNQFSVSMEANLLNLGVLVIGYAYGFTVLVRIRRSGYRPSMKYITSFVDIVLLFLLLFLYTRIEIPAVALKNYVFLIVFPLIALTALRYDRTLTIATGALAVSLYVALIVFLAATQGIIMTGGGYERELFSRDVTYIGQSTKIIILCGYVLLLSYLAHYSRRLFAKLVSSELHIRSQKELADHELRIASQVQVQFLPRSLPEVAGLEMYGEVQQGRFVGGDYYDFLRLPEDVLLMVIGDVSGKGVPAALVMSEIRAATHLLASSEGGLKEFVVALNSLVHQSTDKKTFVTFCAIEVSTRDQRITYVNAGHPPPLVWSDGSVHVLNKGTIPLGVCASLPGLIEHVEAFPSGSVLVSYTDGMSEQTDVRGEQFEERRIREFLARDAHLPVKELGRNLLQGVRKFSEGKELSDDVTLVAVKSA